MAKRILNKPSILMNYLKCGSQVTPIGERCEQRYSKNP